MTEQEGHILEAGAVSAKAMAMRLIGKVLLGAMGTIDNVAARG
jgi:hypothetical protein